MRGRGGSLAIAQRLQRLQPSRCPPSAPVRARDVPRLAAPPQTQHGGPARPPDGVGAPRERERESERASERGGGPPGQPLRDPRPGAPSPPSLRRPAARRRASAPSVPARATRARGGLGAAMIVSGRSGGTPLRRSWTYAAYRPEDGSGPAAAAAAAAAAAGPPAGPSEADPRGHRRSASVRSASRCTCCWRSWSAWPTTGGTCCGSRRSGSPFATGRRGGSAGTRPCTPLLLGAAR